MYFYFSAPQSDLLSVEILHQFGIKLQKNYKDKS